MSVQLFTRHGVQHDGVDVVFPPDLITSSLGVDYLKVLTTSRPLIQAIFPGRWLPKNPSIAGSSVTQRLVKERNVKLGLEEDEEPDIAQQLFDGGPAPKKAKKKRPNPEASIVTSDGIQVMACAVGNAGLCIRMRSDDLEKFFKAMREAEAEDKCLQGGCKRAYVLSDNYKRARASTEAPAD